MECPVCGAEGRGPMGGYCRTHFLTVRQPALLAASRGRRRKLRPEPDMQAPRGTAAFTEAMRLYQRSREWKDLAAARVAEAGHRCEACGCSERLSCHHWTYERAGRELRSDLVVLCWPCHRTVHHLESRLGLLGATLAVLRVESLRAG